MPAPADIAQWQFHGEPTAFIGRVKALHRLREAARNAIDTEQLQVALISGPAGIGKSRLIAEFADSLDDHIAGATLVRVACRADSGPPLSIFRRILERRFYAEPGDDLATLQNKFRMGINQVLGEAANGDEAAHLIGQLVGVPFAGSEHVQRLGDPASLKARGAQWLADLWMADARRRPLVIVIDNLHLAATESLALLSQLMTRAGQAPITFVLSARETLRETERAFVAGLRRKGDLIEVPPLSDRQCTQIVKGLLKRCEPLPERYPALACAPALGNPLALEQIVKLHIEQGVFDVTTIPWSADLDKLPRGPAPNTLQDVVRAKLGRLGPLERSVLEKAAVIGEIFWTGCLEVLRRVDESHGWDDSDRFWSTTRRADELAFVLDALKSRHIIDRSPRSEYRDSVQFAFKHMLEREVLYAGIEGPRRARYHRVIAQWCEVRREEGDEVAVKHIALHWERGHHPRKAAGYYIQAGDRAFEQHVNSEAVTFYERALQCLTDDDAATRLQLFHKLGKVNMLLGDHAEALAHQQEMLRLAWLQDDARRGGIAYNKMGQSYRALGEYDLAIEVLKNGLALFRTVEDIRGIAACADDIGRVHRMRGELDQAEARIKEGLRLRRYLDDPRSVAVSLHHLGNIYTERGDFKKAVTVMREALTLARRADDHKTIADILVGTGVICYQLGDADKALTVWKEAFEIAVTLGDRQLQGILANNRGETLLGLKRHDEAREMLETATHILESIGDRRSLSDALRNLGTAHMSLGHFKRAMDFAEQALAEALEVGARGQAGLARRTLGELCSRAIYDSSAGRESRVEKAARHFQDAIDDLETVGLEAEVGRARLARGAFLAEAGRLEAAREELERARVMFDRLDMRSSAEQANQVLEAL